MLRLGPDKLSGPGSEFREGLRRWRVTLASVQVDNATTRAGLLSEAGRGSEVAAGPLAQRRWRSGAWRPWAHGLIADDVDCEVAGGIWLTGREGEAVLDSGGPPGAARALARAGLADLGREVSKR